jgi:hypothetical protein
MFETSLSWLFILGSIGIGIYACIAISKIRSSIKKQSKDLNERHDAWQVMWAREYSSLENKVEDIQRAGDDTK